MKKSLSTPLETKIILHLLTLELTPQIENILYKIQKRQVAREIRIIKNQLTKNDIANGYTQNNFKWLAKYK